MPFMTETPNSDMKPIAADTLNGSPGEQRHHAAADANGIPASASRLSRTELNRL
jgi:hypothetical protein